MSVWLQYRKEINRENQISRNRMLITQQKIELCYFLSLRSNIKGIAKFLVLLYKVKLRPCASPSATKKFYSWINTKRGPKSSPCLTACVNIFSASSPECWSVLYPSVPIFGELGLKLVNQLQFKCDLNRNTLRNLTLANKANLRKYVEIVNHNTENQKSASFRFRPEVETGHSNTHGTIPITLIQALNIISVIIL